MSPITTKEGNRERLLQPGLRFKLPYGPLELISLGVALIFGTAGLPAYPGALLHCARCQDRALLGGLGDVIIGSFYIMTTFLGFGAATIMGRDFIGRTVAPT